MEKRKTVKFVKYIAFIILAFVFAIACPSFSVTSEAAADNTSVWTVPSLSGTYIYNYTHSSTVSSIPLNFDLNTNFPTYNIPDALVDNPGQLTVTYPSFTYSLWESVARANFSENVNKGSSHLGDIKLFFKDNLGNNYPVDSINGGSFVIEDSTNITTISLSFQGHVSGSISYGSGYVFNKYRINCTLSSFDVTFSISEPVRTITDSEGTVWTVPDGVENPVVIAYDSESLHQRFLIDGTGINRCKNIYFDKPDLYGICSYGPAAVSFYDCSGILDTVKTLRFIDEFNIYHDPYVWGFNSILYGSLPEIILPDSPEPTAPPEPTESPDPSGEDRQPRDFGTVALDMSDDGGLVREDVIRIPGEYYWFDTKKVSPVQQGNTLYFTDVTDFCTVDSGYFNLRSKVDGYVSISFPNVDIYLEMIEPECGDSVTAFPYAEGPEIMCESESVDVVLLLYANGEIYTVSHFGGNVQIPINSGLNRVYFELGFMVKDQFISNTPSSRHVHYEYSYDDILVTVRQYKNQVSSDIEQIKDALQNYDDGGKMDSAADNLTGSVTDYKDAQDSIFDSAGEGIGNFDITVGLDFGAKLLSSIGFLSTVMTGIISAMGDFSMLYTVGACLVLVCILIGLFKYFGGGG